MRRAIQLFILIGIFLTAGMPLAMQDLDNQAWETMKGKHFIFYYDASISSNWIKQVLKKAEKDYSRIAHQLDYSRYRDYWTWDNRVKVYIFSDQTRFAEVSGQPEWSRGGAIMHLVTKERAIVSYKQQYKFIDGVLPHEIAHLILQDFIGFDKEIPLWFNEGVAQLQEKQKEEQADFLVAHLVNIDRYIPIKNLLEEDIREEKDPQKVGVFYLQSVSVVNFLIRQYGNRKFGELCRLMRDNYTFEEAVYKAYYPFIKDLDEFEDRWVHHVKSNR